MKVRDIMSSPPVVLPVDASAAQVAQVLIRHCVSAVPIVDDEGFLVGLVSEADLVTCQTHGASLDVTVAREVMTTDVAVTYPDQEVEAAAKRIVQLGFRRLPVVDRGRVVGVVSRRDLLRHCDVADREINAAVAAMVDHLALGADVTYSVSSGVVTLSGDVPTGDDRRDFHERISLLDGVLSVDDQLATLY